MKSYEFTEKLNSTVVFQNVSYSKAKYWLICSVTNVAPSE